MINAAVTSDLEGPFQKPLANFPEVIENPLSLHGCRRLAPAA